MRVRFETVLRQVARAHERRLAGASASARKGGRDPCLQERIRTREIRGERITFGLCVVLAVSTIGLAAHALGYRSETPSLPSPLPSLANGIPANQALATARNSHADPATTGSLAKAEEASQAKAAADAEPQKPRYVVRWALNGTALVEGREGLYEVRPGAVLPGAGRIMSIEQSKAGWIVVTSETVIGPASL